MSIKNKTVIAFFWQHIKPYKWHYLIMIAAPIITSLYPVVYNYSIKLFLDTMDRLETSITYNDILLPIGLFLVNQLVLELIWRISNVAEWRAEPYVRRAIVLDTYNYVQHHSYKFFQDRFTGSISSKIKGILDGYDVFWAQMHHGLALRVIKSAVGLIALSIVSLQLCIAVSIWTIFYAPFMYKLSKKLNTLSFEATETRHSLIGLIADKISNIISLFSFATRNREYQELHQYIDSDFIPRQVKVYKYDFMVQLIAALLYFLMFGFVLFYVIHLKQINAISIGDFAFVFGITLGVADDIWNATISLQDFAQAMGDLNSSFSILKLPQDNLDNQQAQEIHITTPSVEFKNICFSYPAKTQNMIFKDLNLNIKPGEKIGLVGHSGSGKSTLVNLLMGYFKINSGEILVDNHNIQLIQQDSLREQIAVIPQDTMLFNRTIMENIRYGCLQADDETVIAASKKAHIHEYILSLPHQYNTYVGERGTKLSGGQRQRVAIARAILKNAPILILDEATSALDSYTEKLIQESLDFLIADSKKTVIAIAHRLSTLKHMDRIIVLDKGQIVAEGTHNQLMQEENSLYKQLWLLQELGI